MPHAAARADAAPSFVQGRLVPAFLRVTRARSAFATAEQARRIVDLKAIRPTAYGPPRWLRKDVWYAVDRPFGWPVYTVTPRHETPRGAVVYAHGGAWVNEIHPVHWRLITQIAAEARTSVIVPIYPLLPVGTAGEVVPAVAELVRRAAGELGPTSVAGDSAGGQIALSAAVLLRDAHDMVLPRTVLIAPALDQSLSNPGIPAVEADDPWLARPGIEVYVEGWRGELAIDDPLVSPLAADPAGLGPITLFCGTRDILCPDARLLTRRARAAGVEVDYHEAPGLVHAYPLLPGPEGAHARGVIVEALQQAAWSVR